MYIAALSNNIIELYRDFERPYCTLDFPKVLEGVQQYL
jgi:hypothetical protein